MFTLGLSYTFSRLWLYTGPLPTTPFMVGSGGGRIVKGLVFEDRF